MLKSCQVPLQDSLYLVTVGKFAIYRAFYIGNELGFTTMQMCIPVDPAAEATPELDRVSISNAGKTDGRINMR